MFEKLQTDYQRFLEIESALLDPEVTANTARLMALAKERGTLAKLALPYGRYLELGRDIAEAQALADSEADHDLKQYYLGEVESLRSSDRPHSRHASPADAYDNTSYRRDPSRNPTRCPARAMWRASVTSSLNDARALAYPPTDSRTLRRARKHWPLAMMRSPLVFAPAAPNRYTSVTSSAG